jgi:hypothetical protein
MRDKLTAEEIAEKSGFILNVFLSLAPAAGANGVRSSPPTTR